MTLLSEAAEEDVFLGQIPSQSPSMQVGQGRSAVWTLPLVATQYQPSHPNAAMLDAMRAQQEGRILDALILLDNSRKNAKTGADTDADLMLLRASFLLQGFQSRQSMETLSPLLAQTRYAADAYALTTMAQLQQGLVQEALDASQHAHVLEGGILPHLAHSYALQGAGHLTEAREEMHSFNSRTPQSAVTLAREAEIALTLNQIQSARLLMDQAHALDAMHPYVIAVNGLVYLIEGNARDAKAAFETALKRDPKDAKALFGLGLAEIKLGNFKAGQEKLQSANEADPGNALILTYLGRSLQQSGQIEAARASWRSAQQADPKDPVPWLYQAQAELQANQPMDARESLHQAQARSGYRSVYRGDRLLMDDAQQLRANLAEIQRNLGLEGLAFRTLADATGEKNSANLRGQADVLQGQRFGESARRSLLLQSQFNARPGTLAAELDIYGDGAGQTGASTPQHGVVSGLSSLQASYNNFDELFNRNAVLEASGTTGNQNTKGEQVRLGVGSDTLGLGLAQRHFMTDGNTSYENLDNSIWQGVMQWQPTQSSQAFVLRQSFKSQRGETFFPADPLFGVNADINDNSRITRVGLRHTLPDDSELRGVWSQQQTDQMIDFTDFTPVSFGGPFTWKQTGSSNAHSAELQYRRSDTASATQWGVQQFDGQIMNWDNFGNISSDVTHNSQQFYMAWQEVLTPYLQLDAGLGWGKMNMRYNMAGNSIYLSRWLPKLGMVYSPDAGTHLRFAAWQGMGVPGLGDATLAPVSLAGVLLTRPADNGQLVQAIALGGDRQLGPAWLVTGDTQQRKTDAPTSSAGGQSFIRQQVDESRLALHWQPERKPWTVSMAYFHESMQYPPDYRGLDSVQEQHLNSQQLDMYWFASARWTVNWKWSHNQATGTQLSLANTISIPYQSSFNQFDGNLSWQFYGPRGVLSAGVRNATGSHFQYADTDPLNPRFSIGRLVYARLKLAW